MCSLRCASATSVTALCFHGPKINPTLKPAGRVGRLPRCTLVADVNSLAPLGAVHISVGHGLRAVQPRAGRQQRDGLELGEGEVEVYRHPPGYARNLALRCPPACRETKKPSCKHKITDAGGWWLSNMDIHTYACARAAISGG